MKKTILVPVTLAFAAAASIGIYSITAGDRDKAEQPTAAQIKEMVNGYSTGTLSAKNASITSDELIVTAENSKQTTYKLPQEEFFVSIAPYVNDTHPCAQHSLTGCQGEMTNETFQVTVTNEQGQVLINDPMTSLDNGFIDLWLPRDGKYDILIKNGDKSSEAEISTFQGDNTCIATMQLS